MRLSILIAVVIAMLGIAPAGRARGPAAASAPAQKAELLLLGPSVGQPALCPEADGWKPPPGSKLHAFVSPARTLLLVPLAAWALSSATRAPGLRSVSLSAGAARAPPSPRA